MGRKRKEESQGPVSDVTNSNEDAVVDQDERASRATEIASLFKAASKKYGDGVIGYAKDFRFKNVMRIPSGIFPLDYALGGGWPVGRVSMAYGTKSSSKSTTFLRSVGNAQKMCSDCWTKIKTVNGKTSCSCGNNRPTVTLWLDVEGVWDHKWASRFLDTDQVILSQPATAEETIDIGDSFLRSGKVDIIVIDSIAFMTPFTEIERSSSEPTVGVQARLVGNQMRKFVSGINEIGRSDGRRPTVFLTNQIRMKVGVMYGNPETISGGLAQGFATSVEARMSSGKYTMDDVSGKPMYVEMKSRIEKNKTASGTKMESEWLMYLMKTDVKDVGQVKDEDFVLKMAEKTGLIDAEPGHRYIWNGQSFHGASTLEKYWMTHPDEYEELKEQLMNVLSEVL